MSSLRLQAARELILEKNYPVAKALLETLPNDPTAQKWLQKLEELMRDVEELQISQERNTVNWDVQVSASPFDDSRTVILLNTATLAVETRWQPTTPVLAIRCKEHELEVLIALGTRISQDDGVDGVAPVRIRFDKEPASQLFMNESTTHEAVFFKDPHSAINTMLEHNTMVFEFTPSGASPGHTLFNLQGLSDVIDEVWRSC
jgi:hypothetical protein